MRQVMPPAHPRRLHSRGVAWRKKRRATASPASWQATCSARRWAGQVGHQLLQAAELEVGAGPADDPAGLVVEAGPAGVGLQLGQARLGHAQGVEGGPGEEPVEQQELGDQVGRDRPPVGAQEGLVGRAAAQRRHPVARLVGVLAGRPRACGRSCRPAPGCGRGRGSASRRRGSWWSRPARRGWRPAPSRRRRGRGARWPRRRATIDGSALWVALRHSHISDEMASRAPRAFSRAAVEGACDRGGVGRP